MGQQQLLLLVLGIVIVGLAVVVGIQAFGENQKKANQDAMINDAIRIASDAQAWALKPHQFGGNAGRDGAENTFDGLTFEMLGYDAEGEGADAIYSNVNGKYELDVEGDEFTIEATSITDEEIQVCVTVEGLKHNEIKTATGGC